MFKVAGTFARSVPDRDDLAQEIAAQLWRSFRGYDARRAKFSTWMYRVALNVAISWVRGAQRRGAQMEWLFVLLLWVPLMIVLVRGLGGGDFYAMGPAWLAANVALGIVTIPVLWGLARRYAAVLNRTAIGRWFVDSSVGLGLARARARMADIARFERE